MLSYETRGWGGTGGQIGMAGPLDIADHRIAVLRDRVARQYRLAGDSGGLLRRRAGGSSSGTRHACDHSYDCGRLGSHECNLTTALYGGDTASLYWDNLLAWSGAQDGHEPPELLQTFHDLLADTHINNVFAWSDARWPLNYLEQLCGGGRRLRLHFKQHGKPPLQI
jgi:hypothetical protein